jgi:hypothetical protein
VANKQLLLNLFVTASLAFPGIAAGAFQQQLGESEKAIASHPLEFSSSLGSATVLASKNDISEPNLLRKQYIDKTNTTLWAMCRQTSIFTQIHDFTDCLIANGYKPEPVKNVAIKTGTDVLHAQIMTTQGKEHFLVMLWFQSGTTSGEDRWQWRQKLLCSGMPKLPICKELELTIKRSGNDQQDIAILTEAAVALYRDQAK